MPIYKIEGEKKNGYQKYRVIVNWTDEAGKKRSKERCAYGKAQADQMERKMRDEISREPEATKIMATELFHLWKQKRGAEVRQTTMRKKAWAFEHHIKPFFIGVPLDALDAEKLSAWRDWIAAKGLKTSTKNEAIFELRAYLNFAHETKLIREAPPKIKLFRDPYKQTDAVKLRYYTKDEFQKYAAAARAWAEGKGNLRAWGIYVFFNIAYYTGLRKGENNALKWSDLENGSTMWVRRSVNQGVKGQHVTETPPKNESSVRRLQMPAPLVTILDEHRERQMEDKRWNESYRICGGPDVISDRALERANEEIAKAAKIKKITIHEFRHSHASLLCNAGINIKEIARRLGHADVNMTWKTYSHLYPAEEEKAVAVLNGI